MSPSHHPDPEELLGYATGASPEWGSLLVACHLTFCVSCRKDVALFDELGGSLVEALAPIGGGSTTGADAVLARPAAPQRRAEAVELPDPCLPRPLASYFTARSPKWRFLTPSISHIPLSLSVNGLALRLFKFRSGYVIPPHVHQDTESILIFKGTLGDSQNGERYGVGDVCRNAAGSEHSQDVGKDGPCICLVINEGELVPQDLLGRILKKIAGV